MKLDKGQLRDIKVPAYPNPFIVSWLRSAEARSLVFERGEIAKAIYQEIVTKRTGRLARSARVETFIGGKKGDRWVSSLTVGGEGAGYGPAHEFGNEHIRQGAHDLNVVLNRLGRL